ncbi:patatin-like phospholipase family protein [Crenobacter intestini]|uniref:patatin-like phospholipase family protein n=1 Tax=Crenobacter intestini TaxID=2563443 RepID=UPI00196B4C62|nr:patatin-like phospholipase family protein [Crenobacter intestini]
MTDADAGRKDRRLDKEAQQAESQRIGERHKLLGWPDEEAARCALALSGGGIRSATFSLGVVQALARHAPDGRPVSDPPADTGSPQQGDEQQPERAWLARFDYLSTVSGGGYLGAFLCSLFVPGRFREQKDEKTAALTAFRVLRKEPPERFSPSRRIKELAQPAGTSMPLAWLRDNGRYLLPTGAGDTGYALALLIRNLLSVHLVIGLAVVPVLTLSTLFGLVVSLYPLCSSFSSAFSQIWFIPEAIWWPSPAWWLVPLLALVWLMPAMLAYWLSDRITALSGRKLMWRVPLSDLFLAALAMLLLWLELGQRWPSELAIWRWLAWGFLWVGFAARCLTGWLQRQVRRQLGGAASQHTPAAGYRVRVTRHLAAGLAVLLGVAILALAESLGQSLYLYMAKTEAVLTLGGLLSVLAGLFAAVRYLARFFDEKAPSGWLARLPLGAITGAAAAVLALLLLTLWALAVQWVAWAEQQPGADALPWALGRLGVLLGASLLLLWWTGREPDFLDLSSLQQFYSARLIRAYLGASNGTRFQSQDRASYSSAEPMPGDELSLQDYYREDSAAPLHLINCTLNQTLGPAEQLVQRDRKGKPVCIAPTVPKPSCGTPDHPPLPYHIFVDGHLARQKGGCPVRPGDGVPKGLGAWIAVSGAAFSTGLGRTTSLGTSLLCGLANIRLGRWMRLPLDEAYVADKDESQNQSERPSRWLAILPNQTLLLREWTARFHGLHAPWQYLSDGGHFENLGVYELLRPGREVRLIIACDCGADPDYHFDDLANLVRLVRVDFGREIEVDEEGMAALPADVRRVFATPQQLRQAELARRAAQANPPDDQACAVLLRVGPAGKDEPVSHIVLIKPRVPAGVPVDVAHYAALNPAFPQQTTVDQFFDDQQWESYRKLGLVCGESVVRALASSGEVARWLGQSPEQAVNREGA